MLAIFDAAGLRPPIWFSRSGNEGRQEPAPSRPLPHGLQGRAAHGPADRGRRGEHRRADRPGYQRGAPKRPEGPDLLLSHTRP